MSGMGEPVEVTVARWVVFALLAALVVVGVAVMLPALVRDGRRLLGARKDAAVEAEFAQTLDLVRRQAEERNTTAAINPAYRSRLTAPAGPQHRRPGLLASWSGAVWLLMSAPVDRWRRKRAVPVVAAEAPTVMQVVDPEDPPVRMPMEALINPAHVSTYGADVAPESPDRIRSWLTRQDEYRPRHPGDTEVWVMPANLDEDAEVSA